MKLAQLSTERQALHEIYKIVKISSSSSMYKWILVRYMKEPRFNHAMNIITVNDKVLKECMENPITNTPPPTTTTSTLNAEHRGRQQPLHLRH